MLYTYTALTPDGQKKEGIIDANNRTKAISVIQSTGNVLLTLQEKQQNTFSINLFEGVSKKDLVIFSKQVSILFEGSISPLRALQLISSQTKNVYFRNIIVGVSAKVEQGATVEQAFRSYKDVFDDFFCAIVAVGEASGTLSRSFQYLSSYLDKSYQLQKKIKGALSYPIFVIAIFIIIMLGLFTTIIPNLGKVISESGKELPAVTTAVLGVSKFLTENIFLVLAGLIGGTIALVFFFRTPDGKIFLGEMLSGIPIVGKLYREFYIVRFCENLSIMLQSGVSIVKALEVISSVMDNPTYRKVVEDITQKVRQGMKLSQAVGGHAQFGKEVEQIVVIGEETGEMAKMLRSVAEFYQDQLQDTITALIGLIQPVVIIFLGVAVGGLVGSVILPIYSIATNVT
ncbi:MAG: type II secretion system F family protein [Alphaproteobacteria bacterium]|nr:type II secretion system F family protein [Alphaproteobacteria bacterium]